MEAESKKWDRPRRFFGRKRTLALARAGEEEIVEPPRPHAGPAPGVAAVTATPGPDVSRGLFVGPPPARASYHQLPGATVSHLRRRGIRAPTQSVARTPRARTGHPSSQGRNPWRIRTRAATHC